MGVDNNRSVKTLLNLTAYHLLTCSGKETAEVNGVGRSRTAVAYLNIHCVIKGILNSNGVVSVVSYGFNGVVELYIIVAGGEGG